jgi:hypothetical protein
MPQAIPRDPSQLSEPAVAFLYLAGVPISQLRQVLKTSANLVGRGEVDRSSETFRLAAQGAIGLSGILEKWEPGDRLFDS